jgi:hypothetical protein
VKEEAVSETVGAIILILVAVLAMGIVILVLSAGPLPTRVPSFTGLISNDSKSIYISHEGGDPLWRGQYKILVDGVDRTSSFVGPDPFTLGKNLSYTPPAMNASRVVMIFNTSWGGGTVLLSADLAGRINVAPYGWYNGDWLYRRKITIDHTKVPSDQTDFPVLISKQDAVFTKARIDGNDFLFTDSTGMAILPYEIENFTQNGPTVFAWVKIPALSSTTDTVIYMYYGNPGSSTSRQSPAGVWTNGYRGVWHLSENPAGTAPQMKDSTTPSENGTSSGSMTSGDQVPGFISGSLDFDGSNDVITTGDAAGSPSAITVSAWIKHDTLPSARQRYVTVDNEIAAIRHDGVSSVGQLHFYIKTSGTTRSLRVNGALATGAWYYVVGTWDGTTQNLYKNGGLVAGPQVPGGTLDATTGVDISSPTEPMDGLLDEVRVSNIARSQDWITTEYNNQCGSTCGITFLSVDPTEQTQTTMS